VSYYFSTTTDTGFEETEQKVRAALEEQGFGVLTEIDVQATLKKKLNEDFRKYKILGACNPPYAHKALLAEDRIGLMLPCNLIIQEAADGQTEVAAIDPIASMAAVQNDQLGDIAQQIRGKLQAVIEAL